MTINGKIEGMIKKLKWELASTPVSLIRRSYLQDKIKLLRELMEMKEN